MAFQRHGQIVRQWRVLLALDANRHGLTFEQLCRRLSTEHKVTERTIRRDVDALTLAGFPIDVRSPGRGRTRGDRALVTIDRSNWYGGERTVFTTGGGH